MSAAENSGQPCGDPACAICPLIVVLLDGMRAIEARESMGSKTVDTSGVEA